MNTPTRLAGLAGVAFLTMLSAACTGGETTPATTGGAAATPPPAAVQTQPAPAAAPADRARPGRTPAERRSAAPALRDGTHEARVTGVDAAAGRVTLDVVELLTGAEAARAAAQAGAAEVPPMNDYYIRNVNPLLRTLLVTPGAPITVNVHGRAESGSTSTDISKTLPAVPRRAAVAPSAVGATVVRWRAPMRLAAMARYSYSSSAA